MRRRLIGQASAANAGTSTFTKKTIESRSAKNPVEPNIDWYEHEGKDLFQKVLGRVRNIKSQQLTRRYEMYTYMQAYTSRFGPTNSTMLFSPGARGASAGMYYISANVIKSCIDAATARVAKSKPRAFVLAKKGDYRLKRKCRDATKFLDGAMAGANVYGNADLVFRDACVFDGGNLYCYPENGAIKSRVVKPDELWIEAVDGMMNEPRELHYTTAEPARKLRKQFPAFRKQIDEARSAWRGDQNFMAQSDMVEVTRSWQLPSQEGAKDGVFAMSICTATLIKEPYKRDYFPITRFQWTEPTYGCFGDGIAKELFGMQRTITDVLRGVVKSIRMFAVPRVWVDKQANVASTIITNELSVNEYSGQPPLFHTPSAAAPDIYQFIQWCIDWCYKQIGLSPMSAQSEKPAGLDSGVAMRTFQDVETQRFAIVGARWERWYMQVARCILDIAEDIYKDKGSLSVNVPGRKFVESVDFGDFSLKRDQYDVQVWPTSMLPETPEGKMQAVEEFIQSGLMPRDLAIGQLQNPILTDWVEQEMAAREQINFCLSQIEEKARYIKPDFVTNLDLAVHLSTAAWLESYTNGLEKHKRAMLLRWLKDATSMQKAANDQKAAQQQPPPQGPGGPGGGQPVVGKAGNPPLGPIATRNGQPLPLPAGPGMPGPGQPGQPGQQAA